MSGLSKIMFTMSRFSVLTRLFLKYKYKLLFTYTLFALEMLANLMRPYFVGEAVNDLINGRYQGLFKLILVQVAYLVIGTIRHMYDTRTYSSIYTSLVTKMLSRGFLHEEVSKLSAHSTLAREFIDFLEYDFNFIVEALYNIIGSLIMLYFYQHVVVLICLAVLLPVILIGYRYGKFMLNLTKSKNDELEKQVDIISTKNKRWIEEHYQALRKWQIRISDMEAMNFGIMEVMILGVIIFSLLVLNKSAGMIAAGDIVGIYTYLLKFVSGLDTIPYTLQRFSTLRDLTQRIELDPAISEL